MRSTNSITASSDADNTLNAGKEARSIDAQPLPQEAKNTPNRNEGYSPTNGDPFPFTSDAQGCEWDWDQDINELLRDIDGDPSYAVEDL
jgi:hypothetical protein